VQYLHILLGDVQLLHYIAVRRVAEVTTVVRLNNCRICIFGGQGEHPLPHFHLKGPDSKCSVDLVTLVPIKGHYSRKDLKEAREWLEVPENYTSVTCEWRRLNERG
jgi:Domain of unknown function (DUF4160)